MFQMGIDQFRQLQLRTQLRVVVSLQCRLHPARAVVEGTLAAPTALPVPNAATADLWDQHSPLVKQTVAYGAPHRSQVTRGAFIRLHLRLNHQHRGRLLAMSLTAARYVDSSILSN